jgi:diguanylate cyclase (GGDEF)-like protein
MSSAWKRFAAGGVALSVVCGVAGWLAYPPAPAESPRVAFLSLIALLLALIPVRVRAGTMTFSSVAVVAAGLLAPGGGVAVVAVAAGLPALARRDLSRLERALNLCTTLLFYVPPSVLALHVTDRVLWPIPQLAVLTASSLALNYGWMLAGLTLERRALPVQLLRDLATSGQAVTELALYLMGGVVAVLLGSPSGYLMAGLCLFLVLALRGRLRDRRQLADLRVAVRQDPLTGLANRRGLLESDLRERLLAVVMLDVDNFKQVNDGYGHETGDRVLLAVADILRASIRTGDVACRFGGEEFCVVLQRARLEVAERIAERVRAQVESVPLLPDGSRVTVSVGVATGLVGLRALLQTADAALYEAKRSGKNRVVVGR